MKNLRDLAEKYSEDHKAAAEIVKVALKVSNCPEFIGTVARQIMEAAIADIERDAAIKAALVRGLTAKIPAEAYAIGRGGREFSARS